MQNTQTQQQGMRDAASTSDTVVGSMRHVPAARGSVRPVCEQLPPQRTLTAWRPEQSRRERKYAAKKFVLLAEDAESSSVALIRACAVSLRAQCMGGSPQRAVQRGCRMN